MTKSDAGNTPDDSAVAIDPSGAPTDHKPTRRPRREAGAPQRICRVISPMIVDLVPEVRAAGHVPKRIPSGRWLGHWVDPELAALIDAVFKPRDGEMTIAEAARALACTTQAVSHLLSVGHLKGRTLPTSHKEGAARRGGALPTTFVDEASVKAYAHTVAEQAVGLSKRKNQCKKCRELGHYAKTCTAETPVVDAPDKDAPT
jgi:hypothetical protein